MSNYIVDNLNERVLGFDELFEKGIYIYAYIFICVYIDVRSTLVNYICIYIHLNMHIFIYNCIVDNLNERVLGFDELFEKGTYVYAYIFICVYRCEKRFRE
jgi:hypothetical protein